MSVPKTLSQARRSEILIRNQHACCICGKQGVQIHHINSNRKDNRYSNLAVLCLDHHNEATPPQGGLTAKLREDEVIAYKQEWEAKCEERRKKAARARTAFFMVDYKNAERLRQLFSRLSSAEYEHAFEALRKELQVETRLRKEQGFDVSLEPSLTWSSPVERLLQSVKSGIAHPDVFKGANGHKRDSLLPSGPTFSDQRVPLYDTWCQLMARALIAVRTPYLMRELALIEDPISTRLSGSLVAFEGFLEGDVAPPSDWEEVSMSETWLSAVNGNTEITTRLRIKTHYVYSITAADSLSEGRACGLLLLRNFSSVSNENGTRRIEFTCSPLIIGSGGGGLLDIQ